MQNNIKRNQFLLTNTHKWHRIGRRILSHVIALRNVITISQNILFICSHVRATIQLQVLTMITDVIQEIGHQIKKLL